MTPEARALYLHKLRAFAIHIGISAVVFTSVIAILVARWYPGPYFWIDGGLYVMTVAAFVDIGLGPSITLAVYRPRAPRMRAILAAIGLAQLAALGGGVHLLYEYRPLAVAFVGAPRNEFFPITRAMLKEARLPDGLTQGARERPALIVVEMPTDPAETRRLLMAGLTGGTTLWQRTDLYRPAEGEWRSRMLAEGARNERRIEAVHKENAKRVRDFVAAHGGRFDDFLFVPLNARYGRGFLVFARQDGRLIDTIRM